MLHSITPQNGSSESTFAWIKELLEQGDHAVIASDESCGWIETEHALFYIVYHDDDSKLNRLLESQKFVVKSKNFVIIALNLPMEVAYGKWWLPQWFLRKQGPKVLPPKVIVATTETTIKQAINEATHVNMGLQALAKLYEVEQTFWYVLVLTSVVVASFVEDKVHVPELLHTLTWCALELMLACSAMVWIAKLSRKKAQRRMMAAGRAAE